MPYGYTQAEWDQLNNQQTNKVQSGGTLNNMTPGFGNTGSGSYQYGYSDAEWKQLNTRQVNRLQDGNTLNRSPGFGNTPGGPTDSPPITNKIAPGFDQNTGLATSIGLGDEIAGNKTLGGAPPPGTPPGTTINAPGGKYSISGENGTGNNPYQSYSGSWFSDVPQAAMSEFYMDPEQGGANQAFGWSKYKGFGDAATGRAMNFADPMLLQFAMGNGSVNQGTTLENTGDILAKAMGTTGGPNQYIDPRAIMQNIFAAGSVDKMAEVAGGRVGPGTLAAQLNPPGATPGEQVNRFMTMVSDGLRGTMNPLVASNYMRGIALEGKAYQLKASQNPTQSMSFTDHMKNVYGPTGGF